MLSPEQMGLQNPYTDGSQPIAPQPSGAVDTDAALPADVMEMPAFAATEIPDFDGPPAPTPNIPGGWLSAPRTPNTTTPGQPNTTGGQDNIWESDANPYKAQAQAAQRAQPNRLQELQQTKAQLPAFAAQAKADLVAQGYHPDHADQLVGLATRAATSDIDRQITETVSAPAARTLVADHIAQRFSVGGVKLTGADLAQEGSPQAMEARARALVESRRTTNTQSRAAARTDVVEASSGVASGAANAQVTMTPFEMIRSGIRQSRRR